MAQSMSQWLLVGLLNQIQLRKRNPMAQSMAGELVIGGAVSHCVAVQPANQIPKCKPSEYPPVSLQSNGYGPTKVVVIFPSVVLRDITGPEPPNRPTSRSTTDPPSSHWSVAAHWVAMAGRSNGTLHACARLTWGSVGWLGWMVKSWWVHGQEGLTCG